MQAKVTRRTGILGMAMKLTIVQDGKEAAKLAVDESHTISSEKDSVQIGAKQMMTGSNTVVAKDGDNIVVTYNPRSIPFIIISVILIVLSNVLDVSGIAKAVFLYLPLLGIMIVSMIIQLKAGLIVKKDDSSS